ncbi:MAG: hypothetical protein ACI841_001039, partial [Planctomycetota bacterium]
HMIMEDDYFGFGGNWARAKDLSPITT